MPGVNISARKIRVFIGDDAQDWSPCAGRFVSGKASIGEDGLVGLEATLDIQKKHLAPESLDPENNPARWRPGQLVKVQYPNSVGAYVDHPLGHLYILTEPEYDDEAKILPLNLGCWLAWGDSQEPADDVSAIQVGVAEDVSVICQRYLEAAGIPTASINLGGPWGYAKALPVTKPSGSYIAKAGELAYAADFRVLYQDKTGIVRAHQVTTTAKPTPDLTLDLNTEKLRFARLSDPQEPVEIVRVAGVGETVTQVQNDISDPQPGATSDTLSEESYTLNEDELIGRGVIAPANPDRTSRRRTRLRVREDAELVWESGNGGTTRITTGDTTRLNYYEVPPDQPDNSWPRRNFYNFSYSEKAKGLSDGDESAIPERFREESTNKTHDPDGNVVKIVDAVWAREKEFDPNGGISWRKIRETTQEWIKEGTGLYAYKSTEKAARITLNPNAGLAGGDKWQLVDARPPEFIPAKGKGENEPPPADEWEGPYKTEFQDYAAEVTWVHRGGATGRNRTRTFQLPDGLGFSNGQCNYMATQWRNILPGRKRGRLVQLKLSNALLTLDAPFPEIQVLCLDGYIRTYLLDGIAFEHNNLSHFGEAVGILIKEVAP
ncbi:MAG: hypothetical protein AAGD09_11615 [Cyanobacteria bacterium P01_F01_bin.56]